MGAVATVCPRPGWVRCVQGVTGMVLCWEEHPVTPIGTALGLASGGRALEHFAASGAWDRPAVARETRQLLERARPARWGGYHPVAWDDPKRHRTRAPVWGTGSVHDARARSPHRAETGRAHTGVGLGDVMPGTPWTYGPYAARRDGRQSQWPTGATFHTNTAWAMEGWRQADAESSAPLVGVFDGA
jgi:hypothetical protein